MESLNVCVNSDSENTKYDITLLILQLALDCLPEGCKAILMPSGERRHYLLYNNKLSVFPSFRKISKRLAPEDK